MTFLLWVVARDGETTRDAADGDARSDATPTPLFPTYPDEPDLEVSPSQWGSCVSLRSLSVVGGPESQWIDAVANADKGGRYVAASALGTLTFGAGSPGEITLVPEWGSYVGGIARYDATDVPSWAVSLDGNWSYPVIAERPDGGMVVGIACYGLSLVAAGVEMVSCPNMGGADGLLVGFDSTGALDWSTWFGGSSSDGLGSVASVPDGGFVVAGTASGDMTFGLGEETETTLLMADGGYEGGYVARYAADGSFVWARWYGGSQSVYPVQVRYDASVDAVTVIGEFSGTGGTVWGEGTSAVVVDPAGDEAFIARYTGDGTFQWVETASGTFARVWGATPAAGGDTVATGSFQGTITLGFGDDRETSFATLFGATWLARYAASGNLVWATTADAGAGEHVVSTAGDRVLVAIDFVGELVLGRGTTAQTVFETTMSAHDKVLALYDADGAFSCGVQIANLVSIPVGAEVSIYGIKERSDGGLDIFGRAAGTVRFGADSPAEVDLVTDERDGFVATIDVVAL